jgi:PKD repeat protein
VSIAIVEDDAMDLNSVTSVSGFYRTMVDSMSMHWGTIVPNNLANGVRALEERDFSTGAGVDTVMDADGIWCSGINTMNMSGGNAGTYLNSTFVLTSSASIPDTVWINLSANFNAMTNDTGATVTWDFGDTTTATGASVTHTYTTPGIYSVTVVISNGGCSDTIWHNVVVMLGTSTPRIIQLGYDVSPNPSTGQLNITAKSAIEKEIEVYDVLGNLVYTQTFTGTSTSADLTALEKGVYFLRITENVQGGKTATKRIVLQ